MSDVMERTDLADRADDTVSEHQEVIRAIEPAVADHLSLLLPLDRAWQPTDYLPDLETVSWRDEVEGFRTAAETVSDELLVVLVGDMVTEEALPSYSVVAQRTGQGRRGHQPGSLGAMAAGLDRRGKPARRSAQRLPPSHRPRGHARRGTDGPLTSSPTASTRGARPIPTTSWSTPRFRSARRACRTATSGGSPPGRATRTSPGSAG